MIEFERWLDDRDPARLDAIAAYNEEDCLATLELRDWLLARRPEAEREHGVSIPFLPPPEGRPEVERDEAPAETARLRDALLAAASEGDGRSSARGCSSTTGERRVRVGGGTSAACA